MVMVMEMTMETEIKMEIETKMDEPNSVITPQIQPELHSDGNMAG